MTAPQDLPETPDADTLAFETLVVAAVTGVAVAALEDLAAHVLAAYASVLAAAGGALTGPQARALGAALARALRGTRPPDMNPALLGYAETARHLGIERELRRIRRPGEPVPVPRPPRVDVDATLRAGLDEAARLASAGVPTKGAAASVAGRVRRTRADVVGTARWTAHDGLNAGTQAVAVHLDRRLLWIAERNACLHCLAHAGWVAEPGETFPAVTFDPRGTSLRPVERPPLHPGCRCKIITTDLPAGAPSTDRSRLDPAARLAAEARRSVVYQWTDYASGPAMQRAAEALLRAGADLPRTVEQRARRSLGRGGVRRQG